MKHGDIRNETQLETALLGLTITGQPEVAKEIADRLGRENSFREKALPHSDDYLTIAEKLAVVEGLAKVIKKPYIPPFHQAIAKGLLKQIDS